MNKKKIENLKDEYVEKKSKFKDIVLNNRKFILKLKQLNIYPESESVRKLNDELYVIIEDMLSVIEEKETIARILLNQLKQPGYFKYLGFLKYKALKEMKEMYDVVNNLCESMIGCFDSVIEAGWISEQMLSDFETLELFMGQHCLTCFQIFDLSIKEMEKDLEEKHKFFS